MGLLSLGTPLAWSDACELSEHVRVHGIEQFLAIWRRMRDRQGDPPLWGDELEYMVVVLDSEQKTARLSLRQGEILQRLAQGRKDVASGALVTDLPTFHPEYGRYMIESTPGRPFDMSANELLRVERDMLLRRQLMREQLRPHEVPMTIGSFPRLGVTDTAFTDPPHEAHGAASHSLFLPDEIINTHVRFPTLTANIRQRRGSKVRINVPIFRDTHTPVPFVDPTIPWDRDLFPEDAEARQGAALVNHIYMDAMGFGMGCCCLQVTFQAWSMEEARTLYDQLTPLTPLMLAVTAASPIYRGLLADVDARWNVISAAVDDRTPVERGEAPLDATAPGAHNSHTGPRRLRKSRYDSVDSYLQVNDAARACSDVPLEVNADVESRLIEAGVDGVLAAHMAHLFVRDPLVIFSENVDLDDQTSVDHFENLQSTNWQTMRFKPPPPGGLIGWRIEFRPMEIQLTDFENAAFSVFIALLTRVILAQGVDWYMPISLVDENMQRAQKRDAIHTQRFHFRSPGRSSSTHEYTLAELFHGTGDLPGLLPLVHRYLDTQPLAPEQRTRLNEYLDLVGARADGRLWTPATFLRRWVQRHEAYRHDSVVTDEIHYDLLATLDAIERGEKEAPELLPASYATRRQKGI